MKCTNGALRLIDSTGQCEYMCTKHVELKINQLKFVFSQTVSKYQNWNKDCLIMACQSQLCETDQCVKECEKLTGVLPSWSKLQACVAHPYLVPMQQTTHQNILLTAVNNQGTKIIQVWKFNFTGTEADAMLFPNLFMWCKTVYSILCTLCHGDIILEKYHSSLGC